MQVFFGSWLLFPVLFLMGPEGFGHFSIYGSIIAHTFADLLSKNLWGLLAHHLRNKVRAPCPCQRAAGKPCRAHTHALQRA